MINFKKGDEIYKIHEIGKVITQIDMDDVTGAKNVSAENYYQDFDVYNIVGLARARKNFKYMNDY